MSDTSYVVVKAKSDIMPGEELTVNYGNFSNQDLFTRFGIFYENNPHDVIELELDSEKLEEYSTKLYDLKFKIPNQCIQTKTLLMYLVGRIRLKIGSDPIGSDPIRWWIRSYPIRPEPVVQL